MKECNDPTPRYVNAGIKLVNSGYSEVKYNQDSLLASLTKDERKETKFWKRIFLFPYKNLWRFFLLLTITIVVSSFVLKYTISYIKDVILFKSDLSVNNHGVFMPSKACGRDYCLFLFNTSDIWTNTGIYLNKGDKYIMSISGAFHSSAGDMYLDADNNNPNPDITWIGESKRLLFSEIDINSVDQAKKRFYCIDPTAYIGAILYRIAPEFKLWNPYQKENFVWKPSDGKQYKEVESSGVLSLAINDIYFRDTAVLAEYSAKYKRFDTLFSCNNILEADKGTNKYKRMFYDDNLGQILVCLEIQHTLSGGFFNPMTAFRRLDTKIELASETEVGQLAIILRIIPSFVIFVAHIAALLIINIIIAVVGVWAFFILCYWLNEGIMALNL